MPHVSMVSRMGHLFREGGVNFARYCQGQSGFRIVFCVDGANNGMSSGLRGHKLAAELRNFGWRSIVVPKQLELDQRLRIIRQENPTFVYLQQTRHPLNDPSLYYPRRCILDIDDADFLDENCATIVDHHVRHCFGVIAGSRFIREFSVSRNQRCEVVWTGAPETTVTTLTSRASPPAIVWACSDPFAYPHEAHLVSQIIGQINKSIPFQFWLIGASNRLAADCFLAPFLQLGIKCSSMPFLPYHKLLRQLEAATIGLAPLLPEKSPFSAGKSFGKVLAYLASGVVVVASNSVDHPLFFESGRNGYLVTRLDEWVNRVESLLIDPMKAEEISRAANADFVQRLSTTGMAKRVNSILRKWL